MANRPFPVKTSLLIIYILAFVFSANRSYPLLQESRSIGQGFNTAAWRNSETIEALKEIDPIQYVVTSEPSPVYYLTGIPAISVPEKYDPVRAERKPKRVLLSNMRKKLLEPNTYLVIFYKSFNRPEMFEVKEITEGYILLSKYADGAIYQLISR
jgi:hypothetical protein